MAKNKIAKNKIAKILDEDELEMIAWRAGRGCHFEGGFLSTSEWGRQVIQEDVPLLIAEIRKLRAAQPQRALDKGQICPTCNGLKYIPALKSQPDKQCPQCKGVGQI